MSRPPPGPAYQGYSKPPPPPSVGNGHSVYSQAPQMPPPPLASPHTSSLPPPPPTFQHSIRPPPTSTDSYTPFPPKQPNKTLSPPKLHAPIPQAPHSAPYIATSSGTSSIPPAHRTPPPLQTQFSSESVDYRRTPSPYASPQQCVIGYNSDNSDSPPSIAKAQPMSLPPSYLPPPTLSATSSNPYTSAPSYTRPSSAPVAPTTRTSPNSTRRRNKSRSPPRNRIDNAQMPRPHPPATDATYHTNTRKVPPPSPARVIDTGNASPHCLRSSCYAPAPIPKCKDFPMYLLSTPLAVSDVPVSENRDGPVRCGRCRGYVNGFVTWMSNGQEWRCNLCAMVNKTPSWYVSTLDSSQQRLDVNYRAELRYGSVEYIVDENYCRRPLQECVYVFIIDASPRAVANGSMLATLHAVQHSIRQLAQHRPSSRVAILTFHHRIQFYYLRPDAPEPISVFVVHPDDPVAPLPADKWLQCVSTHLAVLESLLYRLPDLGVAADAGDFGVSGACPTAAIRAAQLGLSSTGGHIFLFTTSTPDIGYGKYQPFVSSAAYGTAEELKLYGHVEEIISKNPTSDEKLDLQVYLELTEECTKQQVAVTVIMLLKNILVEPVNGPVGPHSPSHQDPKEHHLTLVRNSAVFGQLTRVTGGDLRVIQGNLLSETNIFRVQDELWQCLLSCAGMEAVIKLRCSSGYRIDDCIGAGAYVPLQAETELCTLSCTKTFCYPLRYDANLKDGDCVYFQLAVLYTSMTRERRVRVHNLQLQCTNDPVIMFRYVDAETVIASLAKQAAYMAMRKVLYGDWNTPKEFLESTCLKILYLYRTQCSQHSPKGQLILPEALKTLPLYVLSMLKHPMLLPNHRNQTPASNGSSSFRLFVSGCERAYQLLRIMDLPARNVVDILYPRMYNILKMESEDGEEFPLDNAPYRVQMPKSLYCSAEMLSSDGVFLVVDDAILWIYVGRNVSQSTVQMLLGNVLPGSRECSLAPVTTASMSLLHKIHRIIKYEASKTNVQLQLRVIWGGELSEADADTLRFGIRLVEDSIYGANSYVDYLCDTHTKILKQIEEASQANQFLKLSLSSGSLQN